MKSLSVGEIKTQFSEVLEKVQQGESFGITYGKSKKLVAEINPPKAKQMQKKRKLGILEGKMKVVFADDFKMTEEEFINLKV
jgi:antitoxin (DNA-binding transcriptional repressor) of toxin-antitoxin stability system